MINSAGDYQFVTGITNGEVVIDGDILPVRDSYSNPQGIKAPRCLRGEDVAFLAECAGERNSVCENSIQQAVSYSPSVSAQQLQDVCTDIQRYFSSPADSDSPCYFSKDYQFAEKWWDKSDIGGADELIYFTDKEEMAPYAQYQQGIIADPSVSPYSFVADGALVANNIRKLFNDAKRLRRIYSFLNFYPSLDDPSVYGYELCENLNNQIVSQETVTWDNRKSFPDPASPYLSSLNDRNVIWNNDAIVAGLWEKHVLSSFALDLQIEQDVVEYVGSVTALAVVATRMWWKISSQGVMEKHLGIVPVSAEKTNGNWCLGITAYDSIIGSAKSHFARPCEGPGIASGNDYMEYAYISLLGVTPIIMLGDHTDWS